MSNPQADRNLLLGILALQLDFIGREDLIAAMHAWVLEKHKPLGEILREQGKLAPERLELLHALVAEHLKQHQGDPQKSLAAVSSIDSVREQLAGLGDRELEASLAHVSVARPGTDPHATLPSTVGVSSSQGTRFRILRAHARGGLGVISVARDTELNREVALKEIQEQHADDPERRARFTLEAEITGGLEHPGIVPVYGLGQYADGRPFYAMRFVRGDSLKEAIERFHEDRLTASQRRARDEGATDALPVVDTLQLSVDQLDQNFPNEPLIKAKLLDAIARTYDGLGLYQRAIELHEAATLLAKENVGEDHPSTLTAMSNLAGAYMDAGQLAKALSLREQCFERAQTILSEDHPDTLTMMNNLALSYESLGMVEKSLPLHEQTFYRRRRILGEDHRDTLVSMINLAMAYESAGQLEKALPLYEGAVERMQALLGKDHPDTLSGMNNLGVAYGVSHRLEKAISLLDQAVAGRRAGRAEEVRRIRAAPDREGDRTLR
ncbi:MAG: tetratricopeptide repeat protein [Planctomycetes bacterium]|nr:tetratricopeptide repeat protein [Planctomycetota bacterium]